MTRVNNNMGNTWDTLKRLGRLNVRSTNIPKASNSRMDRLSVSTSKMVANSLSEWLRMILVCLTLLPVSPENRTSMVKQSFWRDERWEQIDLPYRKVSKKEIRTFYSCAFHFFFSLLFLT